MNTVRIDYFAVTVKDAPPERVLTDILLIPLENFTLNDWGISNIILVQKLRCILMLIGFLWVYLLN